jgi:hypothetical protein
MCASHHWPQALSADANKFAFVDPSDLLAKVGLVTLNTSIRGFAQTLGVSQLSAAPVIVISNEFSTG